MAEFDPDAYLASTAKAPNASPAGFDPDAYLASTAAAISRPPKAKAAATLPAAPVEPVASPAPSRRLSAVEEEMATALGPQARADIEASPARVAKAEALKAKIARGMTPEASILDELQKGFTAANQAVLVDLPDQLTLGIGSRIGSALDAALSDKSYADVRREVEAAGQARRDLAPETATWANAFAALPTMGLGAAPTAATKLTVPQLVKRAATGGAISGAVTGGGVVADVLAEGGTFEEALRQAAPQAKAAALGGAVFTGVHGAAMGGAEKRVLGNIVKDISAGETSAKLRTVTKMVERMGGEEEFGALQAALKKEPKLETGLAIEARQAPGKAAERVQAHVDKLHDQALPMYDAINEAKGGVRTFDANVRMNRARQALLSVGDDQAASLVLKAQETFIKNRGYEGTLPQDDRLPAQVIRKMATEYAKIASSADVTAPSTVKLRASRGVAKALIGAIEDEGKGVKGFDQAKLREVNREMSMWIPVITALEERATKGGAGRYSLSTAIKDATSAGIGTTVGAAAAGPAGAIVGGLVGAPTGRLAVAAARRGDLKLMRLVRAANAGDKDAALKLRALETAGAIGTGEAAAAVTKAVGGEPDEE